MEKLKNKSKEQMTSILKKMYERSSKNLKKAESEISNNKTSDVVKMDLIRFSSKKETLEGIIDLIDGMKDSDQTE